MSDPLATIISLLRPQTVFSKLVAGAGQWSSRYAPYEDPAFGLVFRGSCFMDVQGVGVVELNEGDFIFLPRTPGFTLATDLSIAPTTKGPTPSREVRHGIQSGEPTMRMLAGYFQFDRANAQLLVSLLPPIVHVRRDDERAARVHRIVELIAEEASTDAPGRDAILERLAGVMLVEALRVQPGSGAQQETGLFAGLSDPSLARALREIHRDVARSWTVAELARVACMSRAVFAERFANTVGMPPMQYLLEWRMAIAKDLLRRERPPLTEVAARVGYQSASAFSTAFTRLTNRSPGAFARSPD